MLHWKQEENGETALLIEGARRIGKSTVVRQFAENEYKSFIMIDFSYASEEEFSLFNDMSNLDYFSQDLKPWKESLCMKEIPS